ncbi:MAG TPA: GNAT family protein [Acidimicrobiales bacterium]
MAQLAQTFHTERLKLRPYELSDLDDFARIYERDEVSRYLYWDTRSKAESLAVLQRHITRPPEIIDDNVIPVAVVLRESNRVIGDFILRWAENAHRQGEIGGSLHPEYQGRGYASEVYRELLTIGFTTFSLHRIVGRCDARNAASVRSLQKVGMKEEAHLVENEFVKGEWTDEIIMAIRKSEWQRQHAS